jgi:hypothetical protein
MKIIHNRKQIKTYRLLNGQRETGSTHRVLIDNTEHSPRKSLRRLAQDMGLPWTSTLTTTELAKPKPYMRIVVCRNMTYKVVTPQLSNDLLEQKRTEIIMWSLASGSSSPLTAQTCAA